MRFCGEVLLEMGEIFMDLKDFFDNQATAWDENQARYRPQ
jgi:hypothetical protein